MQEDNHEIVRFYIDRNHYYEGKASVISKTGAGSITLEGHGELVFKTVPVWDRVKRFFKEICQDF